METATNVICRWCNTEYSSSLSQCPSCGGHGDISKSTTNGGWSELAPVKDMTQIQFGKSTCVIHGEIVPAVELNMDQGESVYFAHHSLLWKENGVGFEIMPMKKGFSRLLAGLPIIMTEAVGPGKIAFSHHKPGEVIPIFLNQDESVDVMEHVFLLASHSVKYDFFNTNLWLVKSNGNEQEIEYPAGMYMDQFTASEKSGLLLLHSHGNAFVRDLKAGEIILVHPKSLLYCYSSMERGLHIEVPGQPTNVSFFGNFNNYAQQTVWIKVEGPGRVAVQSAFIDESVSYGGYVNWSPNTSLKKWDWIFNN